MANKIFLIGIVAGLATALGLASVFSAISTQSTAQTMGGNQMGMMGNNIMTGNSQVSAQQVPWHWTYKASFGSGAISNVENVQVTGISISTNKQITVNLRYSGNGTTPSVVLVASTGSMGMMGGYGGMGMMGGMPYGMMGGMSGMGMMGGSMPMMGYGMYGGQMPMWNSTQWQQWHGQMAQWHVQMNNQMMMNPNMTGMMYGQQMPMWGMRDSTGAMPMTGWQQQTLLTGSTALNSGWNSNSTVRITLLGDGSAYDSNNVCVMVYPLTS